MSNQAHFQLRDANNGGYYWLLQAANNEIVAVSEVYTTKQAAKDGIQACKNAAAAASSYTDHTN